MFNFWQKASRKGSATGAEQRHSIRHRSGIPSILGWQEEGVFRSTSAVLLDVSQGGAAIFVDEATPSGGTAHLRLTEGSMTDWVDVEIRSARRLKNAQAVVHLRFADGCAYSFFRAAIPNTSLDGRGLRYDVDEYDSRHWR
jgi:hypothetical protein